MRDFLGRLAARTLGVEPTAQPLLPAMYSPTLQKLAFENSFETSSENTRETTLEAVSEANASAPGQAKVGAGMPHLSGPDIVPGVEPVPSAQASEPAHRRGEVPLPEE